MPASISFWGPFCLPMRSMGRGTTEGGGGVAWPDGPRVRAMNSLQPAPGYPSTRLRLVPLPV